MMDPEPTDGKWSSPVIPSRIMTRSIALPAFTHIGDLEVPTVPIDNQDAGGRCCYVRDTTRYEYCSSFPMDS
ncbi:hypothetical protein VTK73DRAFT_5603 [Phialemonium thermophilum]|uniref:Uncharacterized protein n=1 Tax=Phialemonium thermophilum TaxID=223376 RepID=A0ABR3WMQ8_9PEZI